jgi:hypothetical protein
MWPFGKKHLLSDEHFKKLVDAGNEAWGMFPGALRGSVLAYKGAEVDFLNEKDRLQFAQSLGEVLEQLEGSPERMGQWGRIYSSLPEDVDRFRISSVLVCKSLLWIDFIAQVELKFPRDGRIRQLREQLMVGVLTPLERYYGESVSAEVLQTLPSLNRVLLGPLGDD